MSKDRHIFFYRSDSSYIGGYSLLESINSIESGLHQYELSSIDNATTHARKRGYEALVIVTSEPLLKTLLKKTEVGNCKGGYKEGDNGIWTPIVSSIM